MIFVTGGTGFLGRHLVHTLSEAGYSLRLLTRKPSSHAWLTCYPNVEVVAGDLRDADKLFSAVNGSRYVIHAGGLFRFWGRRDRFYETNVAGTQNLFSAAVRANVERVVHVSTIAVIGGADSSQVITEETVPHPADAYQRSKLEGEKVALQHLEADGLPVIVLRPGAFYGPHGTYAFNRLFFRDPMRGIIMQVDGGRHVIFPVYIADVVQAIVAALHTGRVGEVYNVCGDCLPHKEVFDIVCEEAGLWYPRLTIPGWMGIAVSHGLTKLGTLTGQEPFWPINLRSYVYNDWRVSSEKAQRELGFTPTDFREGARETLAWYRAGQPENWLQKRVTVE